MASVMDKPRVAAVGRPPREQPTRLERWLRQLILHRLGALRSGRLVIRDALGEIELGSGDETLRIEVTRTRFYRRLALGGSLAAGAAYIDGDWDCDDLSGLFRLFLRGMPSGYELERGPVRVALALLRAGQRLRPNSLRGSRRNVREHYDLGNAFFRSFLDHSLTYSAAVFDPPAATLEQAQTAKLDRICRKLALGPDHHVLEIGCGWGSFALHAARHYGCRVTATTISAEQCALARRRVADAGLSDRIEIQQRDYRELSGRYDRIVSIEMIEAVGHEHLGTFFRTCGDRLVHDGRMLLQVITTSDTYYETYRRSVDFIQRYVFPGGLCPAPMALARAVGRNSDLRVTHLEDLTGDYAQTLRHWRARFAQRTGDILALGYPERFLRLWDFYLQYCEAGFAERHIGTVQMVLARPGDRSPPVRPELGQAVP